MSDCDDSGLGCFKDALDCVLSIREDAGLSLADVYFIERCWDGDRVGDGAFRDESIQMSPIPSIQDLSHDVRVSEGGSYKSGDLILTGISKAKYAESDLITSTGIKTIEKFIKVGKHFYRTIHVKEKLVTWDIHIRKVSQDETERN